MARLCPLRGKAQFDRVLRRARLRICHGWLCLIVLPNDQGVLRLGFILSRKRTMSAVLRNALRRQIRTILRAELTEANGYDLVLLARTSAPFNSATSAARNRQQLCSDLRLLTQKTLAALAHEDTRPPTRQRRPKRAIKKNS